MTQPEGGTEHVPQSWSKDGGQLLFSEFKDKEWTLWTLSVKGRKVAPFGKVHALEPAEGTFSPDGHWVAYRSKESERNRPCFPAAVSYDRNEIPGPQW